MESPPLASPSYHRLQYSYALKSGRELDFLSMGHKMLAAVGQSPAHPALVSFHLSTKGLKNPEAASEIQQPLVVTDVAKGAPTHRTLVGERFLSPGEVPGLIAQLHPPRRC